jgi:hypothetical protein
LVGNCYHAKAGSSPKNLKATKAIVFLTTLFIQTQYYITRGSFSTAHALTTLPGLNIWRGRRYSLNESAPTMINNRQNKHMQSDQCAQLTWSTKDGFEIAKSRSRFNSHRLQRAHRSRMGRLNEAMLCVRFLRFSLNQVWQCRSGRV